MQNEIKYFSMFTGVGGFEKGLQDAGHVQQENKEQMFNSNGTSSQFYSCVGMSENNKYSKQVLKYKFPNIKNWGDCTEINPRELPDFDMLCGGFPCQAFSIAGKRRGFEDIRGTMFFEVARILKIKRPKIILLENVKGLLNHAKGQTFRVILQTLDELGYCVQWMVLNSKFFGVPQNRERVFIVGNLGGKCRPKILPFKETNQEFIGGIKYFQNHKSQHSRIYKAEGISPTLAGASKLSEDCTPKIKAVLTPDRPNKRQNGRRFKEPGEASFTLTGQDIHGICKTIRAGGRGSLSKKHEWDVINTGCSIRRLTPTECCRLQGFEDNWNKFGTNENGEVVRISDTQRYKQMGNAVTTNVIKAIGKGLGGINMTKKLKIQCKGRPDDYQTPESALSILTPFLNKNWIVWECASGSGNLVRGFEKIGFKVFGTDKQFDFTKNNLKEDYDVIVTNPPYSIKEQFLNRCYDLKKPFALLMPLTALESEKRQHFFRKYGIQLIIPNRRINFETPSGKGSSSWFATAWFTKGLNLPKDITFVKSHK